MDYFLSQLSMEFYIYGGKNLHQEILYDFDLIHFSSKIIFPKKKKIYWVIVFQTWVVVIFLLREVSLGVAAASTSELLLSHSVPLSLPTPSLTLALKGIIKGPLFALSSMMLFTL